MSIGAKEMMMVTSLALAGCGAGDVQIAKKTDGCDCRHESAGKCDSYMELSVACDAVYDVWLRVNGVLEAYEAECDRVGDRAAAKVQPVFFNPLAAAERMSDAYREAVDSCMNENRVDLMRDMRARISPRVSTRRGK
ncbi:hypothetical protein HYW82_03920 [Candidatus Peregrinibacteria bacterium]|nr:hypothetical protein [Candidatus Peregrinibacteria bacterium]